MFCFNSASLFILLLLLFASLLLLLLSLWHWYIVHIALRIKNTTQRIIIRSNYIVRSHIVSNMVSMAQSVFSFISSKFFILFLGCCFFFVWFIHLILLLQFQRSGTTNEQSSILLRSGIVRNVAYKYRCASVSIAAYICSKQRKNNIELKRERQKHKNSADAGIKMCS